MDPSDSEILSRIGDLVERENELRGRHRQSPLTGDELRTLEGLEVELDQCWDLLNQRRARREFAMNPDEASVRHEGTVEDYEQ